MQATSYSFGSYVAAESCYVAWGRLAHASPKPVLYLQGSMSLASALKGDTTITRLSAAGYVTACGDISQVTDQGTYGNSTAQTRVGQLKTFIQGSTSPFPAAAGPVAVLGASGGVAAGLNFARANPTLVSCVYGVAPLCALQDVYDNRADVDLKADMDAAYGGSVAASYATHDPSATGNQAALSSIPIRLAYSTDDPYVPVSIVEAYRDLVNAAGGSCTLTSMGAVGHSASGMDRKDLAEFFEENA